MIDYRIYKFSKKELFFVLMRGLLLITVAGLLFYESMLGILLLTPYLLFYMKEQRKKSITKRKQRLTNGFLDGIRCIVAALEAGYSMENAVGEAVKDLKLMYDEDAEIVIEFISIQRQISNNIPVEVAFDQFAKRSDLPDIESFSEVFTTAKRTGGDIIKIIRMTSNTICEKIEVKREITTLISAKQFDVNILKCIPFGIIAYLWITSPGFLSPLYHNIFGNLIMSLLLIIYICICKFAEHITNIEI